MTVYREVYPLNYQTALVLDSRSETHRPSCDEGRFPLISRNDGVVGRLPWWLVDIPDERSEQRHGVLHTGNNGLVIVMPEDPAEIDQQLQELARFGSQHSWNTLKRIRIVGDTMLHDNYNVGMGWHLKWWRRIQEFREQIHRSLALADAETNADSNSPMRYQLVSTNVWMRVMEYLTIHDIAKLRHLAPVKPCPATNPVLDELRQQNIIIRGYSAESKMDVDALDVGVPILDIDDPAIHRLAFHCRLKDQGWGNHKAEIYAVFLRRKQPEYNEFMEELSKSAATKGIGKDRHMEWSMSDEEVGANFAPGLQGEFDMDCLWKIYDVIHWATVGALLDRKKPDFNIELDPQRVMASDRIILYAKSGSGGGHSLEVSNMEFVTVKFTPAWQVPSKTIEKIKRSKKIMDNILSFMKRHHQEPLLAYMKPQRFLLSRTMDINSVLRNGYALTGHLYATTKQNSKPAILSITGLPVPSQLPLYRLHSTDFDASMLPTLDDYLSAYVEVQQVS